MTMPPGRTFALAAYRCPLCGVVVVPEPIGPQPGPNAIVTCVDRGRPHIDEPGTRHLIVDPDLVGA
jgi:hypothetical protein